MKTSINKNDLNCLLSITRFNVRTTLKTRSYRLLTVIPPLLLLFLSWFSTSLTNTNESANYAGSAQHMVDVMDQFPSAENDSVALSSVIKAQEDLKDKKILIIDHHRGLASNDEISDVDNNEFWISMTRFCSLLIYVLIFKNISSILRSIATEKSNKLSEILLSSTSGTVLICGKLLAELVLMIIQLFLWCIIFAAGTYLMFNLSHHSFGDQMLQDTLHSISVADLLTLAASVIYSLISGYLIYASLFAVIGAISGEHTNAREFAFPVTVPLIIAFLMINVYPSGEGLAMQAMGIFPLTAPIILPTLSISGCPLPIIIASVLLQICTIALIMKYAGYLYERGINTTSHVAWHTIVKWIKETSNT